VVLETVSDQNDWMVERNTSATPSYVLKGNPTNSANGHGYARALEQILVLGNAAIARMRTAKSISLGELFASTHEKK
jgi:hypothetical protein